MDGNKTYIELLVHTLKSKSKVLDDIIVLSKEQERLLQLGNSLNMEAFDETINNKGVLIEKLNELNNGFESLYGKIKDDIQQNKGHYKTEIIELKELIKTVTEKSVQIQATEKRNYVKFDGYLKSKRKEIKEFKISSKTASSYYKNMADQHQGQSYFLDSKK